MVDISKIKRLAYDYYAYSYAHNLAETDLVGGQINAWYLEQLYRHDPCMSAEIAISLTEATNLEVPGYMSPQYGHVLIMVFCEEEEDGRVKSHVSELFLRVSETGKIVEVFPFRASVH